MGNKFSSPYDKPSHTRGTAKGEEVLQNRGKEAGRDQPDVAQRTIRDSTSVNPENQSPIDPRMPHFPPA